MTIPEGKTFVDVYDFDGTLTTRDTLLEFISFSCGRWRLLLALLLLSPRLVMMKLHLADNGRAKERLFSHFFRGMTAGEFNGLCEAFGHSRRPLLRRPLMELMEHDALSQGAPVVIVSASIDNWVIPFFYPSLEAYARGPRPITVVGTRIEVEEGRLTGRFLTPNCYGPEKVSRLLEAMPGLAEHRDSYFVRAHGDSRGDRELLGFADIAFYVKKNHDEPAR